MRAREGFGTEGVGKEGLGFDEVGTEDVEWAVGEVEADGRWRRWEVACERFKMARVRRA